MFDYRTATAQQIFDYVVESLLKQGRVSVEDGMCRYRSSNGDKCAAGHLIADADYNPKMEGNLWTFITHEYFGDNKSHLSLIRDLQGAHDDLQVDLDDLSAGENQQFDRAEFNHNFRQVACNHDLNFDVLENRSNY